MPVRHSLEHISEIGERLDSVELCGGEKGRHDGPALSTAVGSGKQVVLAAERNGTDGSLDSVVVEFDTAVVEEAAKSIPSGECVADRLGESATRWNAVELCLDQVFIAATSGRDLMRRVVRRTSAVCPRIAVSIT